MSEMERKVVELLRQGKTISEIFLDETITLSLERIKQIESLIRNENPVVKFDDAGKASVLNYNVPTTSSYRGLLFINLRHPKLDEGSKYEWFKDDFRPTG